MSTTPIDYTALAKQAGAIDSQPAPSQTATASSPVSSAAPIDYTALAKQAGAIDSQPPPQTAPTTPDQPGILSRAWNAVKDSTQAMVADTIPQNHKEELAFAAGGQPALSSHRAAQNIVGKLEGLIKAPGEQYQQLKDDFKRGVQDFQNRDWRNVPSDVVSTAADVQPVLMPGLPSAARTRELSEGSRPGGDLVTPVVKTGLDLATGLALNKISEPTSEDPGIVKQIRKGADVAQPEAEQALRSGVKAGGKEAGLSTVQNQSLRTIVEEPIHSLDASAKSLYRQIDQAAGTDFKALNEKLDNTEYQIRNLTETEEDIQKEAALEKSRTAILDKIESAKQQAKAAGVDPTTLDRADAQFRRARALSDVEAKVFKNPNIVKGNQAMGTPETVDVDSAVKALQKLQDSTKYGGSRLEQALGKDGASQLLKDLYEAQRGGTKALSRQQFAKWTARIVGLGTAEEVVRHAWQQ